ncbi:MAG: hypothetical protein WBJ33_01005 [Candidatus Nanopelagicales bacterium]
MYNVTADPAELSNLYGQSQYTNQLAAMQKIMTDERQAKRLDPVIDPWADGSAQQFPFTPGGSGTLRV